MKALQVQNYAQGPELVELPQPTAGTNEVRVRVRAASVNNVTRAIASGHHYQKEGQLPFIPGLDGVGTVDGQDYYFTASRPGQGTMAEEVVVDRNHLYPLPAGSDPVAVAGAMNPALSSWMALRVRLAGWVAGATVLVMGATGNAGRAALQIARHLGAERVIAAGRNQAKLAVLPADAILPLTGDPARDMAAAAQLGPVTIGLDYLWGSTAEVVMRGLVTNRPAPATPLYWVEIGAMAGATLTLPAALLRADAVEILGSGLGSIAPARFNEELGQLAQLVGAGHFQVPVKAMPLTDFTATNWAQNNPRVVYTMD